VDDNVYPAMLEAEGMNLGPRSTPDGSILIIDDGEKVDVCIAASHGAIPLHCLGVPGLVR
jgi:hypothetical protein